MSKIRTYLRVWLLSTWQPPDGVRVAATLVDANGAILVQLEAGTVRGGLMITPKALVWFNRDVFKALDMLASKMLAAVAEGGDWKATALEKAERRQKELKDYRVAAALKVARDRFNEGVNRAIRKGG